MNKVVRLVPEVDRDMIESLSHVKMNQPVEGGRWGDGELYVIKRHLIDSTPQLAEL